MVFILVTYLNMKLLFIIAILLSILFLYLLNKWMYARIRYDILAEMRERSWGSEFGGHCFQILETDNPGCEASYTNDTTVTLRVR